MSHPRSLWLIVLSALAVAMLVGFIWPLSEGTCIAQGGWIDNRHRICFWPEESRATRPLQLFYFGALTLLTMVGGLAAGGVRLARLVRRNLRRAA